MFSENFLPANVQRDGALFFAQLAPPQPALYGAPRNEGPKRMPGCAPTEQRLLPCWALSMRSLSNSVAEPGHQPMELQEILKLRYLLSFPVVQRMPIGSPGQVGCLSFPTSFPHSGAEYED